MANSLAPANFNRKAQFGTVKSVLNTNTGGYNDSFVAQLSLWCAARTRTLTQQYQIENTELNDTIIITIHHNSKVNSSMRVVYQGKQYSIVDISSDDSNQYMTYDFVTMKLVNKAGGSNG